MKKNTQLINVATATTLVPFSISESYFRDEVANEGTLRQGVQMIILSPESEKGVATKAWADALFSSMKNARVNGCQYPLIMGSGIEIDVGLIDVQVFFDMPESMVSDTLRSNADAFLSENLKILENAVSGTFHNQMCLLNAMHILTPNGKLRLHYHNIFFGLRLEKSLVDQLDSSAMVESLSRTLEYVSVIGSPTIREALN